MTMSSLVTDLRYALDAALFSQDVLNMTPDPWQAAVLRSTHNRLLLNCCRQSGKSTTTAVLALHHALYNPGSQILVISPSQRQSSELFRKIIRMLDMVPNAPSRLENNSLSLELTTHSRIISLPASEATVRGFTADLVIEDEASRVDDNLYRAVRPMLATKQYGRMILMSTPFGKRGHFFHEWEQNDGTWERVLINAEHCPRITSEFLKEEQRSMGNLWFNSEYLCIFADTVDTVFSYEIMNKAFTPDIEPLFDTEPSGQSIPLLFEDM